MKTLLLVGIGIVFLTGVVLLYQQRRRLLRQQALPSQKQTSAVVELPSSLPDQPAAIHRRDQLLPMGPQQRRQMLRYLRSAYDRGPQARLAAMEEMVAWGDAACLPLLRRGLRDADLRVVGLAARGLERFRGPRQQVRQPLRRSRRRRDRHLSQPV